MIVQLDLSPETEARLAAEARAEGLPLERLAERLLQEAVSGRSSSYRKMSVEEFHRMLGEIAEGSEGLPDVPTASFSRESFYEDRADGRDTVPGR
ncbi:MAG TPA: hypothetical protein VL523_02830 [Terriglobia bacterium]|nr:hypothetical protein [Terriglobia bacterium]